MGTRRLRRVGALALATVVVLIVAVTCWPTGAQDRNPFEGKSLFVDPTSQALRAAEDARERGRSDAQLQQRIAEVASGIWLTPEALDATAVREHVKFLLAEADDADATALLVVYGITDRDCTGVHSAGGLDPDGYRRWVDRIGEGIEFADARTAVIIEPDALASLDQCSDPETRVRLVRHAVDRLADAGATVYIDAGHSDWVEPEQMAQRLAAAGVDTVRGFATNVAAYQPEADEIAYAMELARLLDNAHFVIDTGRNGAGTADGSMWCNPDGQSVGAAPGAPGDGSLLDARLWVKPPGESDGVCGGGPPAGTWWPERAVALARAAGW